MNFNLNVKLLKMLPTRLSYLGGFVDADGSIVVQIKPRSNNVLGFGLIGSLVFHQKETRGNWFLPSIRNELGGIGSVYNKGNGKMEYVITNLADFLAICMALQPFLHLKAKQCKYAIDVMSRYNDVVALSHTDPKKARSEFLRLCRKADRISQLNDSRRRTMTAETVMKFYKDNPLPLCLLVAVFD